MTTTINASTSAGLVNTADTSGILQLQTNGTAALTVDASQNVGIGTSSPTQKLDVFGNGMKVNNASYVGYLGAGNTFAGGGVTDFAIRSDNALTFASGGPYERMRIDSSGNLLVGTTSSTGVQNSNSTVISPSGATNFANHSGTSSGWGYWVFGYNGTQIGDIAQNGTTAVSYNTSSDYRLKNTIAPMTGALVKVALLKPCTYKWNVDGSDGQGFIAHELAEVVPDCVSGEKDAMRTEQYEVTPAVKDEEGRVITEAVMGTRIAPVYQGIDTSFLVATLTAAIQEQQAIIEQLQADVATLKGATA